MTDRSKADLKDVVEELEAKIEAHAAERREQDAIARAAQEHADRAAGRAPAEADALGLNGGAEDGAGADDSELEDGAGADVDMGPTPVKAPAAATQGEEGEGEEGAMSDVEMDSVMEGDAPADEKPVLAEVDNVKRRGGARAKAEPSEEAPPRRRGTRARA